MNHLNTAKTLVADEMSSRAKTKTSRHADKTAIQPEDEMILSDQLEENPIPGEPLEDTPL